MQWRAELNNLTFFPLGPPYEYGVEAQKEIEKDIERICIFPHDAGILAQVIYNARHSDHVEIGTFYGGTAILAALVKKQFKMHGQIYCVDPFEHRPDAMQDYITDDMATTEKVMTNAEKFGVADRIVLVPHYSYPWPIENKRFGTGYIDGDHWSGDPTKDWKSLKERVSYAIMFDDYVQNKPDVIMAVNLAMQDPRWMMIHASGSHIIMRRRQ